jgi:hypothetical protein
MVQRKAFRRDDRLLILIEKTRVLAPNLLSLMGYARHTFIAAEQSGVRARRVLGAEQSSTW